MLKHSRLNQAWKYLGIQTHAPGDVLARDLDAFLVLGSETNRLEHAQHMADVNDVRRSNPNE